MNLYLDIDGVLNSEKWAVKYFEHYKDHPEWFDFNNGVRRDGETAKMNFKNRFINFSPNLKYSDYLIKRTSVPKNSSFMNSPSRRETV